MDGTNEATGASRGPINRLVGGRYETLELLGEGSLLQAFRARDRQLNRIVALKTLRPVWAGRTDLIDLLREGYSETLAFQHEAIPRGYDVGSDPEQAPFYTTEEFTRGIDLRERIRRGAPFQLTTAVDIAIALAEALEYAHERGVPHGDLIPAHVLVGPEGQVKLSGFGVAAAQRRVSAEDPAALGQRVPYLAPDLAATGAPTASADLYALSVVLFEMLCGDPPFRGDNPVEVALRHAQEAPVSPRAVNQAVPRALEGIVLKGLGKRPSERYGSAAELLRDLRAVREALRFGHALSWSPLDPPPADLGTVRAPLSSATAPPIAATAAPVVADPRKEPMPERRRRPAADEPPPRRGPGWLTVAVLLSALALVGSVALVFSWMRPYLMPAQVVLVPNLVGKSLMEAQSLAQERGFEIQVIDRQYRDEPPADIIYQMRDKVGAPIRQGQPIAVWVSRGPEMVEVPDVARMSVDKARQMLEKVGLKMGNLTRQWDYAEPSGNVVEQASLPGQRKPRGTRIDLTVSKGPEPEPTPEPDPVLPTPAPEATPAPSDGAEKIFSIPYKVPGDGKTHRIRVDVEDANGLHTAYDESHDAGDSVKVEVTVTGKPYQIRLYDNDVLRGTAP